VVNSGNANCFTGRQGVVNAETMCTLTADLLNIDAEEVFVASTGVIGQPLPMDRIEKGIAQLDQHLSTEGFTELSQAIMTTDTVPKLFSHQGEINIAPFTIVGIAKGAGMIHPDMATMLAFICTDAAIEPALLQSMLQKGVNRTLNRISVDGDTSTNDTALLMANGASGAAIASNEEAEYFQVLLDELLLDLGKALVKDGEGVTKLVEVRVQGAKTEIDALLAANTVATSPLVKTAFFGEDANWGRLLMAIGRSGAQFDPHKVKIYFDDVLMVTDGAGLGLQAEKEATEVLKKSDY
jgi:glutamate N-acetyltransferase/amino-acid N-acetyltransferase